VIGSGLALTPHGGYAGSLGHEAQDIQSYVEWGFDFLKYDWCSYGRYINKAEPSSLEIRQSLFSIKAPPTAEYRWIGAHLDTTRNAALGIYGDKKIWEKRKKQNRSTSQAMAV
jgi:hypothetical protein